jgi:hypothetical protein
LEPDLGLGHDPVSDLRPASSKAAETISERPPVSPEDEPAAEKRGPNLFDPDRDPPEETVVARANPIRPRKKSSSKRPLLLLAGIIVLALLLIGGFFLFHFDSARSPGDSSGPSASGTGPKGSGDDLRSSSLPMSGGTSEASLVTEDVDSKNLLYFAPEQTNHHYRSNDKSGNILIIVGRMTNGYDSPRSFIKVKGVLKNSKGVVVAERESYAGNYLTEAELISLPMSEILTRLAIRSGQNSSNINVAPGSTIPFMLVFDKLPSDLA